MQQEDLQLRQLIVESRKTHLALYLVQWIVTRRSTTMLDAATVQAPSVHWPVLLSTSRWAPRSVNQPSSQAWVRIGLTTTTTVNHDRESHAPETTSRTSARTRLAQVTSGRKHAHHSSETCAIARPTMRNMDACADKPDGTQRRVHSPSGCRDSCTHTRCVHRAPPLDARLPYGNRNIETFMHPPRCCISNPIKGC